MLAYNIPTGIDHDGPIWFHGLIGHLLRVLRNSGFQVFFGTSLHSSLDSYPNVYRVYNYPIDKIDQWHGFWKQTIYTFFVPELPHFGQSWDSWNSWVPRCLLTSLFLSGDIVTSNMAAMAMGTRWLKSSTKKTEEFTDFSELIETSTEGPLSLKRNSTGFNMIKPST